jgi:hypothetical protein
MRVERVAAQALEPNALVASDPVSGVRLVY